MSKEREELIEKALAEFGTFEGPCPITHIRAADFTLQETEELRQALADSTARAEGLAEALEHYADYDFWGRTQENEGPFDWYLNETDGFEKARAALAEYRDGKTVERIDNCVECEKPLHGDAVYYHSAFIVCKSCHGTTERNWEEDKKMLIEQGHEIPCKWLKDQMDADGGKDDE